MIYLKRLWNLIAMIFAGCVFALISPLSLVIEVFVITPILYILKNDVYIEEHELFSVRAMWWLVSKLMFNTNKK
jgi:hypothetical protein